MKLHITLAICQPCTASSLVFMASTCCSVLCHSCSRLLKSCRSNSSCAARLLNSCSELAICVSMASKLERTWLAPRSHCSQADRSPASSLSKASHPMVEVWSRTAAPRCWTRSSRSLPCFFESSSSCDHKTEFTTTRQIFLGLDRYYVSMSNTEAVTWVTADSFFVMWFYNINNTILFGSDLHDTQLRIKTITNRYSKNNCNRPINKVI